MMAQSMQAVNAAVQPGWAGHVGRRSVPNRQPLVVPNFWHVTYDVGRYPTDLLGLQATRQAQAQVLVVPGNPGCAAFYSKFMQQLHTAFGGAADVMAVSHVGHDADNISKGAVWGLHDQVDHKAQLLQELMAPGKPPVIILAHSIGSYIMLQALQQLMSGRGAAAGSRSSTAVEGVAKVFLLMPFLATEWSSWEQRVLAAAARQHSRHVSAAAGWVHSSPQWVQDRVTQLMMPGAEPHAADSLRAALNQPGCRNNWHMAAQEFNVLDGPVDWGLIKALGPKAAVVYNPADPWFQHYHEMREVLPGIEAYADGSLSHAFCLSSKECDAVAGLVRDSVMMHKAGAQATQPAAQQQHSSPQAAAVPSSA